MSPHRATLSEGMPPPTDHPATGNGAKESGVPVRLHGNLQRTLQFVRTSSLSLVVGLLLAFGLGLMVGSSGHNPRLDTLTELPTMGQCMTDTLAVLNSKQAPTPEILRQVLEHCYALIQSQGLLKDFAVREVNYIQQYRANAVLMWMVVAVTLSGVVLAGVQLMASYQLANSGKAGFDNHQLSVTRYQVILKSSVTGLFILVISFAFFLVFVTYVYRFQKPEDHFPQPPPQAQSLPMGHLGPPQSEKP